MEVFFFQNGNTACVGADGQVTELQVPWFLEYVKFLAARGIDPTKVTFNLPGGRKAIPFKLPDGSWNWELS